MDREVVVSLAEARRSRQAAARADGLKNPLDLAEIALALCRDLAPVANGRVPWTLVAGIAKRTQIREEDLIMGAAYAHVRGWVIYSTCSVMLTEAGRAFVASHTAPVSSAAD